MTEAFPNLAQQLAMLRTEYVNSLPGRMQQLEQTYARLLRDDDSDTETYVETLKEFHRLAHGFVGTGATFGFDALSKTARSLEHQAQLAVENREKHSDITITGFRALIDHLQAQVSMVVQAG